MSAIEKDKHVYHIYERSISNIEVYRCIDPDCSHYQPKREFLVGKRAECPKCHRLFIITQAQVKAGQKKAGNKLLTCFSCSKSPKAKIAQILEDELENIFEQLDKDKDNPFGNAGGI